jgi:hypothetical protein
VSTDLVLRGVPPPSHTTAELCREPITFVVIGLAVAHVTQLTFQKLTFLTLSGKAAQSDYFRTNAGLLATGR